MQNNNKVYNESRWQKWGQKEREISTCEGCLCQFAWQKVRHQETEDGPQIGNCCPLSKEAWSQEHINLYSEFFQSQIFFWELEWDGQVYKVHG